MTGVQGTVKAEPMLLIHGKEKLTLRLGCKPCEMRVVGKIKKSVLNASLKARCSSTKHGLCKACTDIVCICHGL